jgi:hypothetical protein
MSKAEHKLTRTQLLFTLTSYRPRGIEQASAWSKVDKVRIDLLVDERLVARYLGLSLASDQSRG